MNKLWLSLKMQFRVPMSIFFSLVFPIVMMVTMVLSYGNFSLGNGYHFIDKYFLVSISIGLLPVAFISLPIWISGNFEDDYLKRLKYLDVNIAGILAADIGSYLILSLFSTFINILVAKIFFGLRLPDISHFTSFAIQIILCILALLLIGTLLGVCVQNSKILLPLGMIFLFLTYMLIGIFVPFNQLPQSIQQFSNVIPLKYVANDLYSVWSGKQLWNADFLKINTIYLAVLLLFSGGIYSIAKFKRKQIS